MKVISKLATVIGYAVIVVGPMIGAGAAILMIADNVEWSKGSLATLLAAIGICFSFWVLRNLVAKKEGN